MAVAVTNNVSCQPRKRQFSKTPSCASMNRATACEPTPKEFSNVKFLGAKVVLRVT
jgi:hypothetical protein